MSQPVATLQEAYNQLRGDYAKENEGNYLAGLVLLQAAVAGYDKEAKHIKLHLVPEAPKPKAKGKAKAKASA